MKKPKIVILGGGESGVGAAILAKKQGWEVFLSDSGEIKVPYQIELAQFQVPFEQGTHSIDIILDAELIVKSPGIPEKSAIIQQIRNKNIPIVSEIEFASRYTNAKIIAITGSNGKTTTTSMIYKLLKDENYQVELGGNIGTSFAKLVALKNPDWYVLEISSFQLDDIEHFHPHIAVVTNITANHLNRYDYDITKYAAAKLNIAKNMTSEDFFIYDASSEELVKALEKTTIQAQKFSFSHTYQENTNSFVEHNTITITMSKIKKSMTLPTKGLKVKGIHNEKNAQATSLVGKLLEIRNDNIRKSLESFEPMEHRLEPVKLVKGITFINDSKATSVNAAWFALESMTQPTIWIVGGVDKGNDYASLIQLVSEKVKGIVMLGLEVSPIYEAFNPIVTQLKHATKMEDAVKMAIEMADSGDCVLLSPACASFDLFDNYEERGKAFKVAVEAIEE